MNDGGPAFPADIQRRDAVSGTWGEEPPPQGMTLRDWFAGQALAGCSLGMFVTMDDTMKKQLRDMAAGAYKMADAMIAERDRT